MQKYIAFVFSSAPYGLFLSQEGLDVVLSTSIITGKVAMFFVSDGVFLLLPDQCSNKIFRKSFVSCFEMLLLCGICKVYLCTDSAHDRGLTSKINLIFDEVLWLSSQTFHEELSSYDIVLRF